MAAPASDRAARAEPCLGVGVGDQARVQKSFDGVQIVYIDETSLRRGQHHMTVAHDLDAKRLLFATEGRDHLFASG